MPVSKYAKDKAREFIIDAIKQANSSINTNVGSGVRAMLVIPSSFIFSGVFEEIERLRNLHLGNYDTISEADMDLLASSLLAERSEGTRSFTNLKLYPSNQEEFTLEPVAYFRSVGGATYMPIVQTSYTLDDYQADEDGLMYVSVPVISREYGAESRAASGDINSFVGLPIEAIKVINDSATDGGLPRDTNSDFFEDLKLKINDGSLSQANGLEDHILQNYTDAIEVNVIDASSPLMMRDEVWVSSGLPNLTRDGQPYASHTVLSTVNFDSLIGRGTVTSGEDISSFVGSRIEIPNDIEPYRVITSVDGDTFTVSGSAVPVESPVSGCTVYGMGPKIGNMTDVYVYFPGLQVRSFVFDNSVELKFVGTLGPLVIAEVVNEDDVGIIESASTRIVVLGEGTANEVVLESYGNYTLTTYGGVDGNYLVFNSTYLSSGYSLDVGESFNIYPPMEIDVQEEFDTLPCIYVLSIERLNPLSRLPESNIEQTGPSDFEDPGWYIKNGDPVTLLSAREDKTIVIDSKRDVDSKRALDISTGVITATSKDGDVDTISVGAVDFTYMEGRSVTVTVPEQTLAIPSLGTLGDDTTPVVVNYVGTEGDTDTISAVGLGAEWFVGVDYDTGVQGQPVVTVETYDGAGPSYNLLATYTNIVCRGDLIIKPDGNWPSGIERVCLLGQEEKSQEETEYSTVIQSGSSGELDVYIPDGFWVKHDGNTSSGATVTSISIEADAAYSNIDYGPMRVTYATHSAISELQELMDSGGVRNLCSDTLIKAQLPSLVEMTLRYRGGSTVAEMESRFVELMQFASRLAAESDTEVRLDISNIVAALDEEGLADYIDTNFEVKVTNYLSGGGYEVRYLNPAKSTKQQMAISTALSGSENIVTLQLLGSDTAQFSGRGKLFLGGNNPDTQEVLPYESVVDQGDGTFIFAIRGTTSVSYSHPAWETAYVTAIDYDPMLEMDGAIFIPIENKPYIKNLDIIKIG